MLQPLPNHGQCRTTTDGNSTMRIVATSPSFTDPLFERMGVAAKVSIICGDAWVAGESVCAVPFGKSTIFRALATAS